MDQTQLWKDFPRTQPAFEARFGDEQACRDYLLAVRWGGTVRCGRCASTRQYALSSGTRWECADCRYQTSLTAGTVLHGTRKPLRLWFRAIWEMMTRRNGVSAKDLQRVLGLGSYQTAWTWLHKLRKVLSPRRGGTRLRGSVQVDESYIGGRDRGGPGGRNPKTKSLMLVAAEQGGRARLAQALHADEKTLGAFVAQCVEPDATVVTDGWHGYSKQALGGRPHRKHIQSGLADGKDALQQGHWAISLVKRWWLGTHHGAIRKHHAQAYFDEFTFRANRRKTVGVGRIVARVLERVVENPPTTARQIIDLDRVAPWFPDSTG